MKIRGVIVGLGVIFVMAGCAHIDKMHAKLDMAEQHMGSAPKPFYEGKLASQQRFGPMTSLQFSDGQIFEVSKAPAGLSEGDTVRIYKIDENFEAHLWHDAKPDLPSSETTALAPQVSSK